jgi:hypothetical protein
MTACHFLSFTDTIAPAVPAKLFESANLLAFFRKQLRMAPPFYTGLTIEPDMKEKNL